VQTHCCGAMLNSRKTHGHSGSMGREEKESPCSLFREGRKALAQHRMTSTEEMSAGGGITGISRRREGGGSFKQKLESGKFLAHTGWAEKKVGFSTGKEKKRTPAGRKPAGRVK